MIRWNVILRFLAYMGLFTGLAEVPSLCLALADGDSGIKPFLISILFAASLGAVLYRFTQPVRTELSNREGILIVVTAWSVASLIGAIPFFLSPFYPSFTDALFESVSGFTTTGSTVLASVEALPRSINLWRHLTHWIGGMGIILLGVAILPLIGVGGMVLYRSEFSGARSEKLTPRISETASSLWKIYGLLSLIEYMALRLAGMDSFEAACHMFSTMGTGGFSTRNASVAAFDSFTIELILIIFMMLAGVNFTVQYRLLAERRVGRFFQDREVRFYVLIIAVATLAVAITLVLREKAGMASAARDALFQVVSITTTTGFVSSDFELWPSFTQLILLSLMFCGGCTGSTAGGMKTARVVLLIKVVAREFRRMVERRGVFTVRLGNTLMNEEAVQGLLNLVYLALLVNFVSSLVLTALGLDVLTSISAVVAAMFNVGPGLGAVGPYDNYGPLPALAKWVLCLCMLAGRLEFYSLLVLVAPAFWKK